MAIAGLTRHASGIVAGRCVDVDIDVRGDAAQPVSHIVVHVLGGARGARPVCDEYITDDADGDQAIRAGFEIARRLIATSRPAG